MCGAGVRGKSLYLLLILLMVELIIFLNSVYEHCPIKDPLCLVNK